ncbi:MAG: hypothetical protein J6T48_12985 [Bacteroidales bacterium]|nr:hypothetical protein [Bacteroidales bacterium]
MDFIKGVRSVLSGEVLMSKITKRRVAIVGLAFLLALLYVVNHFHAIYIYREINKSEERIEKLRAEGVAIQSELLKKTNRRNSVMSLLKAKGSTLEESKCPPHKIIYKPNQSVHRKKKK